MAWLGLDPEQKLLYRMEAMGDAVLQSKYLEEAFDIGGQGAIVVPLLRVAPRSNTSVSSQPIGTNPRQPRINVRPVCLLATKLGR